MLSAPVILAGLERPAYVIRPRLNLYGLFTGVRRTTQEIKGSLLRPAGGSHTIT